jgi:hypothetical protein
MVSTTSGLGYIQGRLFESQSMNTIPNYLSLWVLAHWWHDVVPSSIDDSSVTPEVRATLLTLVEGVLLSRLVLYEQVRGWLIDGDKNHSPDTNERPVLEFPPEIERMFYSKVLDRNTLQNYGVLLESVVDLCERDSVYL